MNQMLPFVDTVIDDNFCVLSIAETTENHCVRVIFRNALFLYIFFVVHEQTVMCQFFLCNVDFFFFFILSCVYFFFLSALFSNYPSYVYIRLFFAVYFSMFFLVILEFWFFFCEFDVSIFDECICSYAFVVCMYWVSH